MRTPTIECPQCGGTGKAKLSPILSDTLALVKGVGKKGATAADIWVKSGDAEYVDITAFNNRLSKLARLGFLSVRREGKFKRYTTAR